MTWRALSSSVRSSSRRVASYPFSSSEEERAGSPSPTAGSRPAPAGDRSPRSRPLGLELRSSAPAKWSRLGLNGSLSPPAGLVDFDHSSAVVSLDFDWFSSSLSWPSRGTSVSWRSGQVSHMLDAILSCIDLWGLMSGFLQHYSCLFLSFATVVFFTTKLALSNFLEGQAVHRFLLCTVCGLDGTTVPTLPGWTDDYPLVTVFESFFRSRLVPSPIGCFSLHREPWSSWPARSSRLLGFLVLLQRDSLFVNILSSVWPRKWHTGTILFELSKMLEVTFGALVQRTLRPPRILRNPVSGSVSPGFSSTSSVQASSAGASRCARRQLSTPSPSGQSGWSGKNNRDTCLFLHLLVAPAASEVEAGHRGDVHLTVQLSL